MSAVEFPKPLKALLDASPLQAAIRAYADQAGHILADNKLDFFPDYTDHGVEHINRVLSAEVGLIPPADTKRLPPAFTDKEAVVLIGATLLHDIAMHLRPAGFLELVGENSRFKPLPWFSKEQQGHKADRPWRELWLDYEREAKRFSDRKLADIIGSYSVRDGWTFDGLPKDPGVWQHNHKLVLGEFIRRHHARLAHEIAHYGFPGLEPGAGVHQFPALAAPGHPLRELADLIGLAARSHGMNLRVCQAYLNSRYPRSPRPLGCALLYPMALLRVADYLQIDRQRTPPALLKLRDPQSPISLQEWQKHLAVLSIDPAQDPRGIMVTVSRDVSHAVYLQLRELLAGLQAEMDHATAVLDEAYGTRKDLGLDALGLATRRVHSNLDEPSFRDELPYVPERTGYSTDPNLLTLLVEPLYGKEPGVGVRELMQNSVDAVRELHAWCEAHGQRVEDLDLPDQEADVLIDFIQRDDGSWFLRCTDKGIGMTADTLQNYFLRAGASFRNSSEWKKAFVGDDGKPKVLRAGRFGIGAFAMFLLGSEFKLSTRHVTAEKDEGFLLEAEKNSDTLITITKIKRTVGTHCEIKLSDETIRRLKLNSEKNNYKTLSNNTDWYCWDWPSVHRRAGTCETSLQALNQKYMLPSPQQDKASMWFRLPDAPTHTSTFEAYWAFAEHPRLACNGMVIIKYPDYKFIPREAFDWPLEKEIKRPCISVHDNNSDFPLTIQRYALQDHGECFIDRLSRDVIVSIIAYSLVFCPDNQSSALSQGQPPHPLVMSGQDRGDLLRWCATNKHLVFFDSWLISLLGTETFVCIKTEAINHKKCSLQNIFSALNAEDIAVFLHREELNVPDFYDGFSSPEQSVFKYFQWFIENPYKLSSSLAKNLQENPNGVKVLLGLVSPLEQAGVTVDEEFTGALLDKFDEYGWKNATPNKSQRLYFTYGLSNTKLEIDNLTVAIDEYDQNGTLADAIFRFVEFTNTCNPSQPESLLAKAWNECLGPKPIPFDPAERQALIERGRQHPELRRHIEAWEEMKRTGSKWVYGGDADKE